MQHHRHPGGPALESQPIDARVLARLRNGAFLVEVGLLLSILAGLVIGLARGFYEESLVADTDSLTFAALHAAVGLGMMAVAAIGLLGWWRILNAERESFTPDRPDPDPGRRTAVRVTVIIGAIGLCVTPIQQFSSATLLWHTENSAEPAVWAVLLTMLTGLVGMVAGVAMIVRFFVGLMFIGRLGERIGVPGMRTRSKSVIRLAIGTACVYGVALIAAIALLVASVAMPGAEMAAIFVMGVCALLGLILGLLTIARYVGTFDTLRKHCKMHSGGAQPADSP